jgi:1,2-diacylglycerol 3-alpha-glucosyltransferase
MKRYGIRDNNKILLVVARLGKEKKITDILKWLQILLEKDPDIQLVIVGDGLYRQKLEKLTSKMNLENAVTFVGKVPPDEVYRFYNIGTVFVSASDFEVNSLAYLEAMACGLPIICRKDLCLKGILEHGVNGYSFETGNEFCRYILQLLDNDDLRLEIGHNAREMSSRFSDRQFVDSMFELYERICTKQEEVFVQ